jgi:hypothetical protein
MREFETAPREVQAPQEPTKIRGHHLQHMQRMVQGATPEDMRDALMEKLDADRADIPEGVRGVLDRRPYYRGTPEYYVYDVAGHTPAEEVVFREQVTRAFGTLAELPDEAPVKIVDGQKDVICRSCIHGKHCSTSPGIDNDGTYIQAFAAVAKKQGIGDEVKPIEEEVKYDDKYRSEETTSLETTAAVVRSVLGSGDDFDEAVQRVKAEHNLQLAINLGKMLRGEL